MANKLDKRTKDYLTDLGYVVEKTEHYNPYCKRKNDLLGFGDYIAIQTGQIVLVQSTSKSNLSARRKKIKSLSTAAEWLDAGGKIMLIGWQRGSNGRYGDPSIEWIEDTDRDLYTDSTMGFTR
jgi:hypothetical protein